MNVDEDNICYHNVIVQTIRDYCGRISRKVNLYTDSGDQAKRADNWTVFQAFIGSFIGILVLSYLNYKLELEKSDFVMIVGSFGAQAVLLFAAPTSPLAQPWNCIFGNAISSALGVSIFKLFEVGIDKFENLSYVAAAASVALSIVVMLLTKSLHPPAGATSLIAVLGSQRIHDLGYWYVLFPAVIASSVHVFIALLYNNTSYRIGRSYPNHWAPVDTAIFHPSKRKLDFSPVSATAKADASGRNKDIQSNSDHSYSGNGAPDGQGRELELEELGSTETL